MNLANLVNDYLLNLPSPLTMKDRLFLDKILSFKIAFNRPHAIQIKQLAQNSCTTYLPYKKTNTNHLGGMHACVLALVGEYSAGLMILRNTGLKDYRIILKELQVKYEKQAKTNTLGVAQLSSEQLDKLKHQLPQIGEIDLTIKTVIYNDMKERVAVAHTHWHLKSWNKVKFK
jgi:acyl-coenzyme A thioesterase PaaI-like protein